MPELEFCPDCFSYDIEEYDDYIECNTCGAQWESDSDQDNPEEYEPEDEE